MTKEEYEKLRISATPRLQPHNGGVAQGWPDKLTEDENAGPNKCDGECDPLEEYPGGDLVLGLAGSSEIRAMVSGNPYARIEQEDNPPGEANAVQVGGTHYQDTHLRCPKCGNAMQHWDVSWLMGWDMFMYCITKYLWRWQLKGGLNDVRKAQHYLAKYIEVLEKEQTPGGPSGS